MKLDINFIPEPIVILDLYFQVMDSNQKFKERFKDLNKNYFINLVINNKNNLHQNKYRLYTEDRKCVLHLKLIHLDHGNYVFIVKEENPFESIGNHQLNKLTEDHNLGYWKVDVKTQKCFWSKKTYAIHEEDESKDILVEDGVNYFIDQDKIIIQRAVDDGILHNKSWDLNLRIKTAKGNIKWVRAIGYPVKNQLNELEFLEGTFEDIDNQIKYKLERKQMETRMEIASKAINFGVWDWDFQNNNLFWDDNMYELYEVGKEDFSNNYQAFEKTLHPDDASRIQKELMNSFENKLDFEGEFKILTKNNDIKYIAAKSKSFYNDKGEVVRVVGANYDVTKIKKYELEQQENAKMIALGELSGSIAHEINNPLTVVDAYISQIKRLLDKPNTTKKINEKIDKSQLVIQKIAKIVKSLNNLNRKSESDFKNNNIKDIVDDCLVVLGEKIRLNNIKIKNHITDETILGDQIQLSQLVINLISNAIDAMSADSVRNPTIEILFKSDDKYDVLSIIDNGMGIAKDNEEKIMQPHFTTKKMGSGTGIGLHISKKIMDKHNGKLIYERINNKTYFNMIFKKEL